MIEQPAGAYEPDLVFPPGETLREVLKERQMTQSDLAERMGRPKKTISEVVMGKARLTEETALELEAVLGISAAVWSNLQQAYDQFKARQSRAILLGDQTNLLEDLPVAEMVKLGWIGRHTNKLEQLREVLRFFAVSSVDAWREKYEQPVAAFRASSLGDIGARAAWFRKAELEVARRAEGCPEYRPEVFEATLRTIRSLTRRNSTHDAFQTLAGICRDAGVVFLVVREIPGAGISGATLWRGNTPAIVITLRFKSDDQLWFSFFHEAAHVLLHRGKLFLELESQKKNAAERKADKFAADFLIAPRELTNFKRRTRGFYSRVAVENFAAQVGVSAGIVVGRLQHDKVLPQENLNGLKRRVRYVERGQE